jgi:hypothetical protein
MRRTHLPRWNLERGSETDVDCGGRARLREWQAMQIGIGLPSHSCQSGRCMPPACTDGVHNQPETDIDCGGPYSACPIGKSLREQR